jgi:hypothetical protein
MSPLRERMIEDMTLAGLALGTRQAYTQAVRRLAVHCRRSPDQLSEQSSATEKFLDLAGSRQNVRVPPPAPGRV